MKPSERDIKRFFMMLKSTVRLNNRKDNSKQEMNTDNSTATENMTNNIKQAGISKVLLRFSRKKDLLRLLSERELEEGKRFLKKKKTI